jgi:hypothetical protein
MDQAEMLTMLSGLYGKLVNDVAEKVIATMAERPVVVSDAEMRAIAVAVFEEMIEPALEQYDPSDVVDQAIDNLGLESDIDDKIEERLEAALENYDFDDKVTAAVRELSFEVSVR